SIILSRNSVNLPHTRKRSANTCGDPTDALPFYRGYNPTVVDHYYTVDVNAVNAAVSSQGYPLQGVATLVFVTQEQSTVPFYHLYSSTATGHLYTISTTERDNALNNGYVPVAGDPITYIYPTQVCGSVPFYRLYHETKLDNFYTTLESE
ncbi:hypothetical protein B0H13DRAFT_1510919, partial [Mycena leptocephala]